MEMLKNICFIGLFLSFSILSGQNNYTENETEQAQTDSLIQQITATWIPKDAGLENRWKIKNDATLTWHKSKNSSKTYHWEIHTSTTKSGLIMSELEIINVSDPDDHYSYLIDTLNEERMILVYQNGGHIARTLFFRQ